MSMSTSNKLVLIGALELTLAQTFVGVNVITGKHLIATIPVMLLLAIRFAIGFVGIAAIMQAKNLNITHTLQRFATFSRRDQFIFILQAWCGGLFFNVLILYGMKSTTATAAAIITSIVPVMIFILSAFILKERMNLQKSTAVLLVVFGLILLNSKSSHSDTVNSFIGNFLVFLSVIPEALFTILSKFMGTKLKELEAVLLVNLFNFLAFIPFALFSINHVHLGDLISATGPLLIYGLTGGILFFLLWYRGLTKVNAQSAALFTGVMPISTTLLAALFLHESIQPVELVGMGFVLLAIYVGCKQPRKRVYPLPM